MRGRVSPVPCQTVNTCRLPYPEEIQRTASGTRSAGHGLRRDMTGSALTVVIVTRLQSSLDATARVLAPSEEAFDTPLDRAGLPARPGPATGRSDAYPDGTSTRWPDTASRTQHVLQCTTPGACPGERLTRPRIGRPTSLSTPVGKSPEQRTGLQGFGSLRKNLRKVWTRAPNTTFIEDHMT